MADEDSRAGERYATSAILEYVGRVHAAHDAGLRVAFDAPDREGMPAIQVGPSEGKLLSMVARLAAARRAVEVGTLAGYSAIRIAQGLLPGGKLWSVEVDGRHAEVARGNIAAAGLSERVAVVVGPGIEVLPRIVAEGPFDLVFVDADKASYDAYGRWARQNLRPGGVLLGDNAFYFGNLLADTPEAAAMRRFHEEAAASFDTVCIPTPDGLLLGVLR